MSSDDVDVLVVGGGVTEAGIALDTVTRGLRAGIVKAQGWASGTSSHSSKLIHGGLHYLYQFNLALITGPLREHSLLLTETAPHLVKAQPFLWSLKMPVIERMYSAVGVGMYDTIAQFVHRGSVPIQRHHTHEGSLELALALKKDSPTGPIVYYNTRVDGAHLVVALVRSAVRRGTLAIDRVQVTEMFKNAAGRVTTAKLLDLKTNREYEVSTGAIIDTAGVWVEKTQSLAGTTGGLKALASRGIYIVVPKKKINSKVGIFLHTEESIFFIIPWKHYWVIGITGTAYRENRHGPVTDLEDIDYVLEQANFVLAEPLTRDGIIGTFTGLHPLLQPDTLDGDEPKSTQVSREYAVTEVAPGLTVVVGDKLTSYRQMAEDVVDFTIGRDRTKQTPSVAEKTPLEGAAGYHSIWSRRTAAARESGLSIDHAEDPLNRYGSDIDLLLNMIKERPGLGNELRGAPEHLHAEIAFGVSREEALHFEDLLARRTRLTYEHASRGLSAAEEVATLAGGLLGWDETKKETELASYRSRYKAEAAAQEITSEAEVQRAREQTEEVTAFLDVVPEIQS